MKTYVKPSIQTYKVAAVNMICESPGVSTNYSDTSKSALGRRRGDVFEDDDEEEDFF